VTRKWPVVGLALALLWLFVRGVTTADVVGEAVIGLLVGMPLAYGLRRFYADELAVAGRLSAVTYAIRYVAVFLRELVTANVDVAYRVLHPSMPIDPDVVAVPLRVESDPAITTIANSITLTPGTLTMDHDESSNTLYVHALVGDVDDVASPIRTWEDYAIRIFDEDVSPSDPARPARSGRVLRGRSGGDDDE
jgi:multicomponent Na+:H+ antiporter subunit E